MLKTLLKAVGILACMIWFNLVSAATMGGINVMSALGHPLKAEISLGDLGKKDQSKLVAKMASVNEFKGAGLDFPYSLPKLAFEVATRSNGEVYIKLTSSQPVNEPFVSLLVELNWASGKLLREYTFLLDPAGFVPEQPKAVEVQPVEPMIPVPTPEAAAEVPVEPAAVPVVAALEDEKIADKNKTEPVKVEPDATQAVSAEPALVEADNVVPVEQVKMEPLTNAQEGLAKAPAETGSDAGSVQVEKGDTLGKIADGVKPADVSLERMLVAMYRANAKQFNGKNMNRIKAGKILRMPEADEIAKVTQKAAVREIRAQVADWQDYRQKLAAVQSTSPEQAPTQEAAGKISAAVAEKAPVIKDSAKEVLRLSKGESLGDKTVTANSAKSKKEELIARADDASAKAKQQQEEQNKIKKLESISKDASKLVELKLQPAEAIKPPVAKVLSEPSATPVAEEKDIVETITDYVSVLMDDPIMLAAGAAVLLGLGGLGFVVSRRGKGVQKKTSKKNEELGSATGSWRTPVAPSPDTGDFTHAAAAASGAMPVAAALDDVDPISEADLFLNFGRDVQAEEILKDALKKTPGNVQVKLKLLSIYVNRKDSKSFSKYAQEIKNSGDATAWERAAVMGLEVDPTNPAYGGAKGEVRQREAVKAEVDFDLGLDKVATPATGKAVAAQDFKMDFDLSGSSSSGAAQPVDLDLQFAKTTIVSKSKGSADVDATSILSREVVKAAENASPMDFDVSGILPGDVKGVAKSSMMDFDISGIIPDASSKSAQSSTMDFDVTSGQYENTAILQAPVLNAKDEMPAMNFNDLVFEIPTSKAASAESTPAAKPMADEGMAFTIDFPTSDENESASRLPASANKIDFGDININLDEEAIVTHAGGEDKDEQWHEVATKLDLAKAYQEMGDADGAKEILEEVVRDGDMTQRESAEKLLQQITA